MDLSGIINNTIPKIAKNMKRTIKILVEIETEASINDIHNAVNIGLNDAFPDNGITTDHVNAAVYEINDVF